MFLDMLLLACMWLLHYPIALSIYMRKFHRKERKILWRQTFTCSYRQSQITHFFLYIFSMPMTSHKLFTALYPLVPGLMRWWRAGAWGSAPGGTGESGRVGGWFQRTHKLIKYASRVMSVPLRGKGFFRWRSLGDFCNNLSPLSSLQPALG